MHNSHLHPSSFRDPSGFIFESGGKIYRQVNNSYSQEYDLLMQSGLYEKLATANMLIAHEETGIEFAYNHNRYKTLAPVQLAVISYPYEWCSEQLKDAALHTLSVLKISLDHGMIIKDATPFNIQFHEGKPLFIDTLSFEKYNETKPWVAYRQFCNMFLFPLYLAHYLKTDIQKILISYPEGIPVEITSKLLPLKSSFSLGVWLHVYMQNAISQSGRNTPVENFSRKKLMHLVNHLESIILRLNNPPVHSQWLDYYETSIMGKNYLEEKERIFSEIISRLVPGTALDIGCNDGRFSLMLADKGFSVIAADSDSRSIGKLYNTIKVNGRTNIIPLLLDVASPTPAIGFRNRERPAFHERIHTELVIALALIHHLVIGRNIPLKSLAQYFRDICSILIIEWVPREDEKVREMLSARKDIFDNYTQASFESEFGNYFHTLESYVVNGTLRRIYLMKKK